MHGISNRRAQAREHAHRIPPRSRGEPIVVALWVRILTRSDVVQRLRVRIQQRAARRVSTSTSSNTLAATGDALEEPQRFFAFGEQLLVHERRRRREHRAARARPADPDGLPVHHERKVSALCAHVWVPAPRLHCVSEAHAF
jgi:hypothetical protein